MATITKVSDITYEDLAAYLRLDELDAQDIAMLNTLMTVAKTYIKHYTGRTDAELDDYVDFIIVVFVLVQDMWDNRTMYVDGSKVNDVVQSILDMHVVNLLPIVGDTP